MDIATLTEWVAISTIASGAAAVFGLGFSSYNIWRTETQVRRQKKVDSARFTVDYIESIFNDNQSTIRVLDDRQSDKSKKFSDDRDVEALLNGLDNVIQFINDNVMDKSQALTTIRITLRRLKNDDEVKRIIAKKRITEKTAFDKVTKFWDKEID